MPLPSLPKLPNSPLSKSTTDTCKYIQSYFGLEYKMYNLINFRTELFEIELKSTLTVLIAIKHDHDY